MSFVATAFKVGTAAYGAYSSYKASKGASGAGISGKQDEIDFLQGEADAQAARQRPFLDTSYGAINAMNTMMGLPTVDTGEQGGVVPYREGALISKDSIDAEGMNKAQFAKTNWVNRFFATGGMGEIAEKYGSGEGVNVDKALRQWAEQRGFNVKPVLLEDIGKILKNNKGNWAALADKAAPADYDWETSPGYEFRRDEGAKALERRQSAGGSYLSGKSLKGAMEYGQEFASAEFGNIYNQLGVLAGYGPAAASGSANQYASQQGSAYSDMGAYRASDITNRSNILGEAVAGIAPQIYQLGKGQGWWGGAGDDVPGGIIIDESGAYGGGEVTGRGGIFSDRRLKRDIKKIGHLASGLAVYVFNYIWGESSVGVMADEAREFFPDAVAEHASGYLMVDYSLIK